MRSKFAVSVVLMLVVAVIISVGQAGSPAGPGAAAPAGAGSAAPTQAPNSGAINSRIDQSAPAGSAQSATPQDMSGAAAGAAAADGTSASGTAADGTATQTPGAQATDAAQTAGAGPAGSNIPPFQSRDPRYKINVNDVLAIAFPFTPEYNETVTVQPDGFINLRQLPDMKVAGLDTPQATEVITKAYSKLLHDPIVTVTLQNFLNPYFIAYGEVTNPGKFQLYGPTTVAQAIGIAGGYTSKAKHSDVYLFRRVNDQWVSSQKVDLKHMLYNGNLSEDQTIHGGDMIWVPKATIAKIISLSPIMPYNFFRINYGPGF
jgi:polysaccharide export outer membrane protein